MHFIARFASVLLLLSAGLLFGNSPELPDEVSRFKLLFAGDLMGHEANWNMDSFTRIYHGVRPILAGADYCFINLETPVDDSIPWQTFPKFNVHYEYVAPAVFAGFNVFSLANNHTLDQGVKGVNATLNNMKDLNDWSVRVFDKPVRYSGLHIKGEREWTMVHWVDRGVRFGFIAITEITNEHDPTRMVNIVDIKSAEAKKPFLRWLSQEASVLDVVVISVHNGVEYSTTTTRDFKIFAQELSNAGATFVWGHHPHVLQNWYFLDRQGRHATLVLPSMGNFISGQISKLGPKDWNLDRALTGDSLLLQVELSVKPEKQDQNKICFQKLNPILIGAFKASDNGILVRSYADLLTNAQEPWRTYYRARFRLLTRWLPATRAPSLFAVPVSAPRVNGMFPSD